MSAAICAPTRRRANRACEARTPPPPGFRCGAAPRLAGSGSIRPTTCWWRTTTSCWPWDGIFPMSRRSMASSWAPASRSSAWPWTCCWWNDGRVLRSPGPPDVVERIGAQRAEEFFDFARQGLRRRGQFAGYREHRFGGRRGLAHGVAERADVDDQGAVALGGHLRIHRDFAGRGVLLSYGAGNVRRHRVDFAHGVADLADGLDRGPGR